MSEDREVWRTIPSLPDYIASSWGRVMRVPYRGPMPHGGERPYGGVPHFGVWSRDDERFFFNYLGTNFKIARLICEAFHGPSPFEGAVCMHADENSRNNRPENLSWGTQKENLAAPGYRAALSIRQKGDLQKLTADDVCAIRASSKSNAAIAREYGVSACHVSRIRSGAIRREAA